MIVESSRFRNIDNSKVSVGLKNLHISFTPKKKKQDKRSISSLVCTFLKSWEVASCEFFWSSLSGTLGTYEADPATNESHIN